MVALCASKNIYAQTPLALLSDIADADGAIRGNYSGDIYVVDTPPNSNPYHTLLADIDNASITLDANMDMEWWNSYALTLKSSNLYSATLNFNTDSILDTTSAGQTSLFVNGENSKLIMNQGAVYISNNSKIVLEGGVANYDYHVVNENNAPVGFVNLLKDTTGVGTINLTGIGGNMSQDLATDSNFSGTVNLGNVTTLVGFDAAQGTINTAAPATVATTTFTGKVTAATLNTNNQVIFSGNNAELNANLFIASTGELVLDQTQDTTYAKDISGTGTLIKNGTNTITLTGNNTSSGATTINSGSIVTRNNGRISTGALTVNSTPGGGYYGLDLGNNQAVKSLTGTGTVNIASGKTFTIGDTSNADSTFSGSISGEGAVTKTGTGTLVLSGSNTYAGMTEIQGGTLELSGSLTSNLLTLYDRTSFKASNGLHSLDNGELHVHGQAAYIGALSAKNALLNFYIPTTMSGGSTLLTVTGAADIGGSTVNVGIEGGSSSLRKGDTITLINATSLAGTPANTIANGHGMQGVSLLYDFTLSTNANQLLATLAGTDVNPQTKALSEGRLGGMAFVTQGADILTGTGMQSMQIAAEGTNSTSGFGLIQGSTQRIKTGSHVDVDGLSLLAGVATPHAFNQENLTAAAFFEAGWGNYDSYNSFANAASVYGNGDTSYYGVGIMGKLDMSNGFYTDSSLRVGRVETDFNSGDMRNPITGQAANYDSKSTYYGASISLGKIIPLDEQKRLDIYGRYLWTRMNSENVTVVGDRFNFDAINSHRVRAGVRYLNLLNTTNSFYVGAAYDYEFDGDANGSVHGYRLESPSLKGGTGIFELGVTARPQDNERLSIDMGINGYVGQREGVAGSVKVNYVF